MYRYVKSNKQSPQCWPLYPLLARAYRTNPCPDQRNSNDLQRVSILQHIGAHDIPVCESHQPIDRFLSSISRPRCIEDLGARSVCFIHGIISLSLCGINVTITFRVGKSASKWRKYVRALWIKWNYWIIEHYWIPTIPNIRNYSF